MDAMGSNPIKNSHILFLSSQHPVNYCILTRRVCTLFADLLIASFANCQLRSMVFVDRSMMRSDSAKTNYPGKIPYGLDLPSDVTDRKLPDGVTK
ncbi:hypothetical protein SLEP1_g30127 [Rubroshorea leprosula]|uniref:Uncharacterized protein n=1 Tax=Rubroshorea leprosula TaxID=152421 RepID=A0AAV5K8K7_9ROSI|nr:hypothetical protein SLEP1_g30127 [Rubroshorea leprosula]